MDGIGQEGYQARQGGRVSSFFCASVRFGRGSRLVRRPPPEWPSDVPGRVGLLGLSSIGGLPEKLRLNDVPIPAKLCRLRGVLAIPVGAALDMPDGRRRRL